MGTLAVVLAGVSLLFNVWLPVCMQLGRTPIRTTKSGSLTLVAGPDVALAASAVAGRGEITRRGWPPVFGSVRSARQFPFGYRIRCRCEPPV